MQQGTKGHWSGETKNLKYLESIEQIISWYSTQINNEFMNFGSSNLSNVTRKLKQPKTRGKSRNSCQ